MASPDPCAGVDVDVTALKDIVSQVFKIPKRQCGPAVAIGLQQVAMYARVYSLELPDQTVVVRVVAPVKPLFKTESEVAAMDYIRGHTSLPVPEIFSYCSEANNPVGAEWILMQHMPGAQMDDGWYELKLFQKQRLALDIICLYDQLFKLRGDVCGVVYHSVSSVEDHGAVSHGQNYRSPRWKPLSLRSLRLLRSHCTHHLEDRSYSLGTPNDISLLNYRQTEVPSHSHTLPTFTSEEYFKLVALNGIPSTRTGVDLQLRKRCVELFQSIQNLHRSPPFDSSQFHFSHGDLHDANILIDPDTGAITAILDWESAGFRPAWVDISGIGWFEEDAQRFIIGDKQPENFEFDTEPRDAEMRAFLRVEMYKKNLDLFGCFFGGVEMRAVLQAATDDLLPVGKMDIFLRRYFSDGYWNEGRRGVYHEDDVR